MTDIFDGMAGMMNDTFGADVIYTSKASGDSRTVRASLRDGPLEVSGGDGVPIVILAPTLHVPRNILPDIRKGDRIAPVEGDALGYIVVNRIPNGSPASDAMIVCELEEVIA
jgi:hypothetical protein